MQKGIFHTAKGHLLKDKSIATERHAPHPAGTPHANKTAQ